MQLGHSLLKQADLVVALLDLALEYGHLGSYLLSRTRNIVLDNVLEHGGCALPRAHLILAKC